jgi:putative hemolysin
MTTRSAPFSFDVDSNQPLLRALLTGARPLIERLLSFGALNALYEDARHRPQARFADRALAALKASYDVDDADLQRIPRTGPLIVVANHPHGALDGLILTSLLQRVRPDVRLLANFLLERIPEMRETSLFVDPFGGAAASRSNITRLRAALRFVQNGGALGVFPAGEVSHWTVRNREIADPEWSDAAARIVQRTSASVLPVFLSGRNSLWFHAAGLLHPRLRTLMLPHELLRMRGRRVRVQIGGVIAAVRLRAFGEPRRLTDYLRLRTYVLRGRDGGRGDGASPGRGHPRTALPAVCAPLARERLISEIEALTPSHTLVENGDLRVLCIRADAAPAVMHEIARLREVTFRAAGEGSGREIDLDRFDADYLHLFLWDKQNRRIAGAYRLGLTDELLARRGLDGLYTSTLFRIRPTLLEQLGPSIEMGRSFVVAEQQRSYTALMMLWQGIGRFVVAQPKYRMLFGAVSISNDYQSMTQRLLMAFLRANDYEPVLSRLVAPRHPPLRVKLRVDEQRLLSRVVHDVQDMDELVREIERDRRSVPVLLRQYLRLNGRLLGFNVDPDFGDVLDGLILVDLTRVDRPILNRYMTPDGATTFLDFHAKS